MKMLTLETSATLQTPQAKNIPYQPLLIKVQTPVIMYYVMGIHAVQFGNNWMQKFRVQPKWTRPQSCHLMIQLLLSGPNIFKFSCFAAMPSPIVQDIQPCLGVFSTCLLFTVRLSCRSCPSSCSKKNFRFGYSG